MKLYLCGPKSGPGNHFPEYSTREKMLLDAGFEVINPLRTEPVGGVPSWLAHQRAMLLDLAEADGVATMPRWMYDANSTLAADICYALRLPVKTVETWVEHVEAHPYVLKYGAR